MQKLRPFPRRPGAGGGQVRGRDGNQFWVEVSLKYGRIRGNDRIIAVVRDVTERKLAEEQIRASLKEKEVMLKEIHHRVKNNLQVISSLLSIQSRYLADPRDASSSRRARTGSSPWPSSTRSSTSPATWRASTSAPTSSAW